MADKTMGGAAVGGGADVSALGPQMVASLLGILQGATSPDAMEAQNILLRRLALQGDVVPSRVPAPRNITEIGGYFNLLQTLQQPDMLSQVLAAILGVAGPTPALGWISNNQPLAFLQMTNDRPAGPAQATLPLTVPVRSDLFGPLQAAIKTLHDQGGTLPLTSTPSALPPAGPGATAPADVLPYLGRTLDLAARAALVDPATDALALVRPKGSATPFEAAARVIAPATVAVTPADYDALQCDATSCTPKVMAAAGFVLLAPVLAAAGFYPASPLPQPSSNKPGSGWNHYTNVTGLVTGVTKLGDELSLLYTPSAVNGSVFGTLQSWLWNGKNFAKS